MLPESLGKQVRLGAKRYSEGQRTAEPVEDKDFLAERLEEDRQKMAVQVSELKEDYNVPHQLRASVQKHPWTWVTGAVRRRSGCRPSLTLIN
jgi:hypothetical protein